MLYKAMQRKDPKTLQVRGWCLLSATSSEGESGDLKAASAILNNITGGKASKHTDLPKPGRKPSSKKSSGDAKKPAARKPATTRKRKAAPDVTQCGIGAASVT